MAYTPTVWATGDTITAEKLNKAENGIAAANMLVVFTSTEDGITASETFETVLTALNAGAHVMFKMGDRLFYVASYNEPQSGMIPIAGSIQLHTVTHVGGSRITQSQITWSDDESITLDLRQYPAE